MSADRPTVSSELVAAIIESTPDRVRRRLDKAPDAAAGWEWQAGDTAWSVAAGGETVTLPHGHVVAVEQVACTCLLSPRCFHVLACLTRLEVIVVESQPATQADAPDATSAVDDDAVELDEKQRQAARQLQAGTAQLLRVGVANAGLVVQSGLLRAVHQCRADGLHRLAALGLRVIAGAGEFRRRAAESDPAQLAADVADVLETIRRLLDHQAVAGYWIGTARRKQSPVRPRKLHGLFAEPIITRSGFAGAAAYFLGEDDRIYTASDVRAGDAQHARDAYLGGIEIGPLVQPARQLARGQYLGTDLTASADGRLGRGKGIKIVEQGASTWQAEPIQARFRRELPDQWNEVYAQAALPAEARPAGWDFVFLEGTVLGAAGPELLFQTSQYAQPIRLAIENESESLCFRENLRILSHAPGLRLQVIARVNLAEPRIAAPLAAAPPAAEPLEGAPRLELPASWAGRVCLGFDELQRHFLIDAQPSEVVLSAAGVPSDFEGPLAPLRRRWIAAMLAGLASQRPATNMLAAEKSAIARLGLVTAAALLDALSTAQSARSDQTLSYTDTFLATAVYLRACNNEWAKSRANLQD